MNVVGLLVIASVACLTMLSTSCRVEPDLAQQATLHQPVFAMKIKQHEWFATDTELDRLVEFCLEYGVNRLMVKVQLIPEQAQTQLKNVRYHQELSRLITRAASHGIDVEAIQDIPELALEPNHADALTNLNAIIAFNRTLPHRARLVGVHYEISLHLLPQWQTHRQDVMQQCLDLLATIKATLKQNRTSMDLSATMPHWYDNRFIEDDSCVVAYYGQSKNFHEHLQDLTDYMVVQCRRRRHDNEGSINQQVQTELDYAHWIDRSISVSMETSRLDDAREDSYHGRPAWEFWLHKREAEQAYSEHEAFRGVVVNRYDTFRQLVTAHPTPPEHEPIRHVFGMWVWHEQWVRDEQEHGRLLAFCQEYGINLLPIQIHVDTASVKRGQPQLRYPNQLRRLIQKASSLGIRVEMLDGAPEMGLAENRPSVLAILDMILAFDRTLPPGAGIVGIHYDIEPYLLPQWNTPKRQEIMHQYLELFEAAGLKLKLDAPRLTLSASIPFWYDHKTADDDHCILEYNGQRKNFHEHIQDLTDYVAVMSYRRHALGDDSITQHVEVERAYAEWIGRYVCAGMETMQLEDEPEVSFYGVPTEEFWFQKQKVEQALDDRGGFGGIVVHSYETFEPYLAKNRDAVEPKTAP